MPGKVRWKVGNGTDGVLTIFLPILLSAGYSVKQLKRKNLPKQDIFMINNATSFEYLDLGTIHLQVGM